MSYTPSDEPGTGLERRRLAAPAPIISNDEIDRTYRVAQFLAASRFFDDAKQAEQAFAKILAGRELGLAPFEAMQSIDIIQGRPEARAQLHAARVKNTPGYDYLVDRLDNDGCELTFYRDGLEIGKSEFTREDAKRAGLDKRNKNYDSFPRNMFFARAMSNGVAFHCPEVMGSMRVYTPGEIEEQVGATTGVNQEEPELPSSLIDAIGEWAPSRETGAAIYATILRARTLGHAGLQYYPAIEMELRGKPAKTVDDWAAGAKAELDELEASLIEAADADEVGNTAAGDAASEPPLASEGPVAGTHADAPPAASDQKELGV